MKITEKEFKEFIKKLKEKKAWIIGNIIRFEKPTYKSPFFDTEEFIVISKKDLDELSGSKEIKK